MTATAEAPSRRRPAAPPPTPRGLRKDIQGLRAIAVTLVVVFHLWPATVSGGYVGVDIFLVISGYLITSHLLKKPPRSARDLGAFWARRLRRLLPASLTVLAATAVATRLVAPSTTWEEITRQIVASTLYVQNWALASSSVDYMDAGAMVSPVQHFWSLSVEEQFYLVWPLLILGATWVAHRVAGPAAPTGDDERRIRLTRTVIGVVVVTSLAYSVWYTAVQPAAAYFVTPTRMWELALGGFIATIASMSSRRGADGVAGAGSAVVAWAGVAAMVIAAYLYTSATPFPGAAALLPVLGAAAVILADTDHPLSPTTLLRNGPVQWLGDVSYSVYLWHWPLIALVPYVSGGSLGVLDKSVILVATLALAGLSKIHIEDRFRFARPHAPLRYSYAFAAAGMVGVLCLTSVGWAETEVRKDAAKEEMAAVEEELDPVEPQQDSCLGAAALIRDDCDVAPEADYVVLPSVEEGRQPSVVLHHYVAESKRSYFQHGWRHVLPGLPVSA